MTFSHDLGWAGGFFDGEGCVFVRLPRGKTTSITVQVSQRLREPLDRFAKIVGLGGVYKITPTASRSPFYVWGVRNAKDIAALTDMLIPFCTVKRDELVLMRRIAVSEPGSNAKQQAARELIEYQKHLRVAVPNKRRLAERG
jgi:hypothetical protein